MDVVVIGGGAAGMMAACTAAQYGASVTLLERNAFLGVKLNITGKGRCNLTNNCDVRELISAVPGNGRFLYSAFAGFDAQDTMQFFENLGVSLKTERGNRVFPVSDRAKDISGALRQCLRQCGVKVVHTRASGLCTADGMITGVETADRVIPASGADSGDRRRLISAYRLRRRRSSHGASAGTYRDAASSVAGAPCVGQSDLSPARRAFAAQCRAVRVVREGKTLYEDFGETLFTGHGMSGPMILSASAHLAHTGDFACTAGASILEPALDMATLAERVLRDFSEAPNRNFSNALAKAAAAEAGACDNRPFRHQR